MLERASTCLESGGRQLLRSPKQCLRSRRMLHSAFWNHGASELNLPIWWAASSMLGGANGDSEDRSTREPTAIASTATHGGMLDFLYPEKTLDLLKRLSLSVPDTTLAQRRRLHGTHVRAYSTAPWQPPQNPGSIDAEQVAKQEVDVILQEKSAIEALQELLCQPSTGKQNVAWLLYNAIPEAELGPDPWPLRLKLLGHLSLGLKAHPRALDLFDQIPVPLRQASSYRTAVVACLSLRMVGRAIQLVEDAITISKLDPLNIGIDAILWRTIMDEQWALCLRVFGLLTRGKPRINGLPIATQIQYGHTIPQVTRRIAKIPSLHNRLTSLLRYVRSFQNELKANEDKFQALSLFSMIFVPFVIKDLFQKRKDEKYINKFLKGLFEDLDNCGLPTSTCYESAILLSLEMPRYQAYPERAPIWLDNLYGRYRKLSLGYRDSKPYIKPSKRVLRNLMLHYEQHNMMHRVDGLLDDMRTFYPDEPLAPGTLKDLAHIYAEHGHVDKVKQFLDDLNANHKGCLDIFVIQALLFAYARRADVDGAIAEFRRISEVYQLEPDIACWNALLLAHVRADDLEGALDCFNNCIESGFVADEFSYNTLLNLCADRGDIEAFEALFSKAKESGIALMNDVRARSGYVLAFLNAGDIEGAYQVAQSMLRHWKAGTLQGDPLTHAWNLLIQHHALRRDLTSARARYKEMIEHKIPLDTWTFGGLIRALVEVKQSNAAYKILRVTMPSLGVRAEALHYAIVITGLLKEGGEQIELALDVFRRMKNRNVAQTEASRGASLQLLGQMELRKMRLKYLKNPSLRLKDTEALLRQTIEEAMQEQSARLQPRHSRSFDTRPADQVPQIYYGLLISLYTERGAFRVMRKLVKRAQNAAPDNKNYTPPMTFIDAIMSYHLMRNQHADVAKYWQLARETADNYTKTVRQAIYPDPRAPPSADLIEDAPTIFKEFRNAPIARNRRHILFKASRTYIRSLLSPTNNDPTALTLAQTTIRDLLIHGYTVDNFSWNELVTTLAQRGHVVNAFKIMEAYLMPSFPGWRELNPGYSRRDRSGYSWMELRHTDITRTALLPRYKTIVVLAAALKEVRKMEREGRGYVEAEGMWMRDVLERVAPMTYRAIETMPKTNDRMQTRYIHG